MKTHSGNLCTVRVNGSASKYGRKGRSGVGLAVQLASVRRQPQPGDARQALRPDSHHSNSTFRGKSKEFSIQVNCLPNSWGALWLRGPVTMNNPAIINNPVPISDRGGVGWGWGFLVYGGMSRCVGGGGCRSLPGED